MNNDNNTDTKLKVVNNPLTYHTKTNQINVDNDKLEQDLVENNNYLNDQQYNNTNNNITTNDTRTHYHTHNANNDSNNQSQ